MWSKMLASLDGQSDWWQYEANIFEAYLNNVPTQDSQKSS